MKNKKIKIKKWEIWLGEYHDNGYHQEVHLLDTVFADTFENAVLIYYKTKNKSTEKLEKVNERMMRDYLGIYPSYKEAKRGCNI